MPVTDPLPSVAGCFCLNPNRGGTLVQSRWVLRAQGLQRPSASASSQQACSKSSFLTCPVAVSGGGGQALPRLALTTTSYTSLLTPGPNRETDHQPYTATDALCHRGVLVNGPLRTGVPWGQSWYGTPWVESSTPREEGLGCSIQGGTLH